MRSNSPSLTALYVAFARAVASEDETLSRACHDPFARRLLPRLIASRVGRDAGATGRVLRATFKGLSLGLCQHVALRTALIDRALEHAVATGRDQLVLLGAGFDSRAHRLPALARVDVYEVDHPATQRFKRERMGTLPVRARSLSYLPCDFERRQLVDVLRGSAFVPTRPSIWLWEGVTMYLSREAVVASLRTIAELGAAGSLLVATYLTPELVATDDRVGRELTKLLGVIAEPIRYAPRTAELHALLGAHRFVLRSDTAPKEAAPHFGIELGAVTLGLPAERLVVAQKQGDSP